MDRHGRERTPDTPQLDQLTMCLTASGKLDLEHTRYQKSLITTAISLSCFPNTHSRGPSASYLPVSVGGTVVKASPDTNFGDLELYKVTSPGAESSSARSMRCSSRSRRRRRVSRKHAAPWHRQKPPATLGRLIAWLIAGVSVVWLVNAFSQTSTSETVRQAVLSYRQT